MKLRKKILIIAALAMSSCWVLVAIGWSVERQRWRCTQCKFDQTVVTHELFGQQVSQTWSSLASGDLQCEHEGWAFEQIKKFGLGILVKKTILPPAEIQVENGDTPPIPWPDQPL